VGLRGARVGALCLAVAAIAAARAGAATYSNTEAIQTNLNSGDASALLPYPSQILVQGEQGTVVKATVTLNAIAHERLDELSAIIVAPGGQKVIVMGRPCSPQDTRTNPLTFTFDDDAASNLPASAPCVTGTYKPSDYNPAPTFEYPAPPSPYPSTLAALSGATPNGAWKLFMHDSVGGEPGSVAGGWSLQLTTTGAPAAVNPICATLRKKLRKAKKAGDKQKVRKLRRKLRRLGC
jgi:subtilisin-like proprotein convertase family protein